MKNYKNLTIIGSSHIAKESILQVKEFILDEKPDIIALELDYKRMLSLFNKRKLSLKDIKEIGIKAFLFNLIGAYIEKKLGKIVDVTPGSEMKTAINLAKKNNIKIFLIDQDIQITLKKLAKISLKEKFKIIKDILKGLIFRKNEIEPFDLTKVPKEELILKLLKKVKERYPEIYKILIIERNEYMGKALNKIIHDYDDKKILAVIGAGHEKGVFDILQGI